MKLQEHPQALRSALCYIPTGTHTFLPGESLGEARAQQRARKQRSSSFPDSPIRPSLWGQQRLVPGGGAAWWWQNRQHRSRACTCRAAAPELSDEKLFRPPCFSLLSMEAHTLPCSRPDTQAALSYLPPAGHSSTWKFFP